MKTKWQEQQKFWDNVMFAFLSAKFNASQAVIHSKLLSTPVIRTVLLANWIAIWLELDKEKISLAVHWSTGREIVHEACTNCSGLTKCSSIPSLHRKNFLSLWRADVRSQKPLDQITEQNDVTLWLYSVPFDNWMWNWNAQIAHCVCYTVQLKLKVK